MASRPPEVVRTAKATAAKRGTECVRIEIEEGATVSDTEVTNGGSQVLRHEHVDRAFVLGRPAPNVDEVEAHISRVAGEPETVFHEIASDLIHLDVHIVRPAPGRDWWTLFTVGMSALPMTVPEGRDELRFAELVLKLPSSWKVEEMKVTPPSSADMEAMYWPIRGLKYLARLPHDYGTFLAYGHTVPNGDPPQPLATGTALCAWLILPLLDVPREIQASRLSDGTVLNLYSVHAIHRDELELKLSRGMGVLLDAFDRALVSEVLDPARPSSVPAERGRGLRSLFGGH